MLNRSQATVQISKRASHKKLPDLPDVLLFLLHLGNIEWHDAENLRHVFFY